MTVTQAIGYILNNDTGVTQYTSNRIFHGYIPETENNLPAISYFKVSSPNLWGNTERPRIQVSIWSTGAEQCENIAFYVRSAINNYQNTVNSTFDIQNIWYEESRMILEQDGVFHNAMDISVLYIRT